MNKADNSEKLVETILANVEVMRKNAEEMRIWRNLPIAKETFELIKQVGDDEGPIGRAMGCEMVVDILSEYDAPRFTLQMLRYELEQLQMSEEKSDNLTEEDVINHIAELERFIDTENVSYEDYRKQSQRTLLFDPIERTPIWEEINQEIEAETDALLGDLPRGMGFCFGYWSAKRSVLAKHGIKWRDPHQMNPRVIFD